MLLSLRPVVPLVSARRRVFETRRDRFAKRAAMLVTVITALVGVVVVAAAAVLLAIT